MVRLPLIAVSLAALFSVMWISDRFGPRRLESFALVTIYAFTSYSVGQFVGQVIRSPIVASFLACVCSGLLFAWAICVEQIHVPIVFQFVPSVILLAASWLRSRDWMEERRSVATWSRLTASVLIPFVLLYGSIGLYRMSEVPRIDHAVQAKNLVRPFVKRYEPALRHGQVTYRTLAEVFDRERKEMLNEVQTIISAAKDQSKQPRDPDQPNLNSQAQSETIARQIEKSVTIGYLANYHSFLLSVLLAGSGQSPLQITEAVPLLRDLHARHFSETRQRFRQATREANLIWPREMFHESTGQYLERPFIYLLALVADESARAEHWEESLEDSLCLWRFGRQIYRQSPDHVRSVGHQAISLSDHQLVSVAEKCRSPELIRRAIRELTAAESAWPISTDDVREQWASFDQTTLESDLASSRYRMLSLGFGIMPRALNRIFPWEVHRNRRELNALFAARIAIWEAIDAVVRGGQADRVRLTAASPPDQSHPTPTMTNAAQPATEPIVLMPEERLLKRTEPLFQQGLFESFSNEASPPINDILRREVWYRTLILRLALIAWRHEHGHLPDRLEDLVGTYLERLPLDPLSGKPFVLVKTIEELKRLFPDGIWSAEHEKKCQGILPGIFAPSSGMGGALRVTRPDGRGEAWIEFDPPSGQFYGWPLPPPK